MWAAASVLGAVAASRFSHNSERVKACIAGTATMALAFIGFAVAPAVAWLIPVVTLGGVGNGLINVCVSTVVITRTVDRDRGRVSAALGAVMNSAAITSLLAGGVLASFISPREVFLTAGLLGSAAVVLTAPRVLRAARMGSVPDAVTEPGLGSV
jgi:MFS family permease